MTPEPNRADDLFRDLEKQLSGGSCDDSGGYPVLDLSSVVPLEQNSLQVITSQPSVSQANLDSLIRSITALNRRIGESLQMVSQVRQNQLELVKEIKNLKAALGFDDAGPSK